MSINLQYRLGAALMILGLGSAMATSPVIAQTTKMATAVIAPAASFEQDRTDILAMAGDYKVTFDMKETTAWRDDYTPIEGKITGGHESVRVVKDSGTEIILQHILVADFNGDTQIIKHWRQDWKYQPTQILAHSGAGEWTLQDVAPDDRKNAWSQTVYQVDDSPRYAGVGRWEVRNGVRTWTSDMTSRPLARRDATRNPVYDHYQAINRHQITPTGWIHWQDNSKMKMVDGTAVPYVQEIVLNTYQKFADYNTKAADDYWAATSDYWASVRAEWDAAIAKNTGMAIAEEPNTGTVISGELLHMGTQIAEDEMTQAAAIAAARTLIRGAVQPVGMAATARKPQEVAAK